LARSGALAKRIELARAILNQVHGYPTIVRHVAFSWNSRARARQCQRKRRDVDGAPIELKAFECLNVVVCARIDMNPPPPCKSLPHCIRRLWLRAPGNICCGEAVRKFETAIRLFSKQIG